MPRTPYTIQLQNQYHHNLQLIITGELDETNADEAFTTLEKKLSHHENYHHISCDFSDLSYTNSKTLSYLVDFIGQTHRRGKTISFDHIHPQTRCIFDMIGLSKITDQPLVSV